MSQPRKLPIKRLAVAGVVLLAAGALAFRLLGYATPIDILLVAEDVIHQEVKGPGSVSSDVEVNVASRISGVVQSVLVQEGDHVKEGQLLFTLDERDLAAKAAASRSGAAAARQNVAVADAALEKAQADLALARANYARDETVYRAGHISQAAFDSATASLRVAESAEKNARAAVGARREETRRTEDEARYADTVKTHAQVTAPIAGLVTRRQVEVGNTVAPGTTLLRIVDDKAVAVATRVDVSQMGRVQLGQPARIKLVSGAESSGTVARISHEADPATRDQEVRVRFDTPPARLTLNEEAEVIIRVGEARGLVIAGSAVVPHQGEDTVLVLRDGRTTRVSIRVGAVGQGKVLVEKGLAAGDRVVARPAQVKPGARARPMATGQ